jgi:hypothetical protein
METFLVQAVWETLFRMSCRIFWGMRKRNARIGVFVLCLGLDLACLFADQTSITGMQPIEQKLRRFSVIFTLA